MWSMTLQRSSLGGLRESRVDSGETAPAEVVIFDGEPIIGQALELLLQDGHRSVKFLEIASMREPGLLEGVRVLLLGPGWSAEGRKAALAMAESEQAKAGGERRIQVLEVGAPPEGVRIEPKHHMPWPCGIKELKQRVNALLNGGLETSDGCEMNAGLS